MQMFCQLKNILQLTWLNINRVYLSLAKSWPLTWVRHCTQLASPRALALVKGRSVGAPTEAPKDREPWIPSLSWAMIPNDKHFKIKAYYKTNYFFCLKIL